MPELTVYFTVLLAFIAIILSVILGLAVVIASYHAIRWGRQTFELLVHRHLESHRAHKKAAVIVLPAP